MKFVSGEARIEPLTLPVVEALAGSKPAEATKPVLFQSLSPYHCARQPL